MKAIATMPAFSHTPGTTPASNRPRVTQLSAVSTAAALSAARPPASRRASASSGSASSPAAVRAPRVAHAGAATASGGIATSASQVRPSATRGSAAIAPTTTAIDSGSTSAQPRPANRASGAGTPRAGSTTSAAWIVTSKLLATRKRVLMRSIVTRRRGRFVGLRAGLRTTAPGVAVRSRAVPPR